MLIKAFSTLEYGVVQALDASEPVALVIGYEKRLIAC